jgi:hypothetical protein
MESGGAGSEVSVLVVRLCGEASHKVETGSGRIVPISNAEED